MSTQTTTPLPTELERTLMRRDSITLPEVRSILQEVRSLMENALSEGDFLEAERIVTDELGLEPDYLLDLF